MQNWIDSAAWKPVPGGLSSDAEFRTNMRKFDDPNDSMTRLKVYGAVGANNAGRTADKEARQAAHEAEVAERLVAKRRRADLGDITNQPVTADGITSSGRGSSSSYAVCAHPRPCRTRPLLGCFGRALMPAPSRQAAAAHASSRSGSPSMRSCCSSSSSYAACFGSVSPPPPIPARFVPQLRPLSAGRGRSSADPLRRAQRHDPTLVRH